MDSLLLCVPLAPRHCCWAGRSMAASPIRPLPSARLSLPPSWADTYGLHPWALCVLCSGYLANGEPCQRREEGGVDTRAPAPSRGVTSGWWSSAGGPLPGPWLVSAQGFVPWLLPHPMDHHVLPAWLLLSCVAPPHPLSFVGTPP